MKQWIAPLVMLLTLMTVRPLAAQEEAYLTRLRAPSPTTGKQAVVFVAPDAAAGLRVPPKSNQVNGYRICLAFDNTQNGRSVVGGALASFREKFGNVPGEITYNAPTFKAYVGYYLTLSEVSMLFGRTKERFPSAVIVHETFPIGNLVRVSGLDPDQDTPSQENGTQVR